MVQRSHGGGGGDRAALQNFREHLRQRSMTAQEALAGLNPARLLFKGELGRRSSCGAHPEVIFQLDRGIGKGTTSCCGLAQPLGRQRRAGRMPGWQR